MQLSDSNFIFSNRPRYRLARHGLFWGVVWLYFTVLYGVFPIQDFLYRGYGKTTAFFMGFLASGVSSVVFMPAHMVLAYGITYILFPRYLNKGQYWKMVIGVIFFSFLSACTSAALSTWIVTPLHTWLGTARARGGGLSYLLMAGLRGGITVAGFVAAIKLVKIWYLKEQAFRQIEKEKFQAELQLLKSQIHPHFLFNTLNNLYALTLRKSEQSPAVVMKLSQLLSYMLYDCNASEVPLEKEITFLKNYIGLEQLRYGARLEVSMNFHGDLQSKQIAPLLLIPFLENAFKHGTSEQLEQAWIFLDLAVEDNVLTFKLVNSRDADAETLKSQSAGAASVGGIGLQNVRKRLELLYPQQYELQIQPEEETFLVDLALRLPEVSPVAKRHPAPLAELPA
ncbi:sensor histidine kinase [Larkinella insperata]|uniref:Sensor histidine kinase n=1 Tax=Larkinella insperata TaxID=332158 RepID=A0ABW3Q780_9BACT|nr:histidine kinase [Larkinella insperata]